MLMTIRLAVLILMACLAAPGCKSRTFNSSKLRSSQDPSGRSPRFEELSPESPEWKRISVRDPKQEIRDPNYLKNLHQGIAYAFAPWFKKDREFASLPFREILRLQHARLISGESGGGTYVGATLPEHGIPSSHAVKPGRFRYEIHAGTPEEKNPHILTFQWRAKVPEGFSRRIVRLQDFYRSKPPALKAPEPPAGPNDPVLTVFTHPAALIDVRTLPRIDPARLKVWNEFYENWVSHHYPRLQDVPILIDGLVEMMEQIRKIPPTEKNRTRLLEALTQYLYLGIHSHPFEAGNFSLVMSQVNYILMHHSLSGISHENLDWLGLIESYDDFRPVFLKAVDRVNSGKLKALDEGARSRPPLNILAHISQRGDAVFLEKEVVEDQGGRGQIEGINVMPPLIDGLNVEYMGHIAKQGDSAWLPAGQFLGERGQWQGLEGLAFRVSGAAAPSFRITYQVRAGTFEWSGVCTNGQFCGTRSASKPLTGLRVWLDRSDAQSGENDR